MPTGVEDDKELKLEETPEVPPEETPGAEPPEAPPEAPPAPTVEDALAKIDALVQSVSEKDKRIEALEGKLKEQKPAEEAPKPAGQSAIGIFVNQYLPKMKEKFSSEETTSADRFEAMVDVSDKMLGAVLTDKILPTFQAVAQTMIDVSNRLEAVEISSSDPDFAGLRSEVFGILAKLPLAEREKNDAVASIYKSLKPKAEKKPASREVLRDVGTGGNGAESGKGVVLLSADQEEDRKAISLEAGHEMSRQNYKIKYDAKVKYYKSQGKKIPATLRDF